MNVEFVENKTDFPKLSELPEGAVFSPINSKSTFIVLSVTAMDDVFTDSETIIEDNSEDWQEVGWGNDCNNLIAVVDLSFGGLMFLPRNTKVKSLNCKLVVEE